MPIKTGKKNLFLSHSLHTRKKVPKKKKKKVPLIYLLTYFSNLSCELNPSKVIFQTSLGLCLQIRNSKYKENMHFKPLDFTDLATVPF